MGKSASLHGLWEGGQAYGVAPVHWAGAQARMDLGRMVRYTGLLLGRSASLHGAWEGKLMYGTILVEAPVEGLEL